MQGLWKATIRLITKPIRKDHAKPVGKRLRPAMFYQSSRTATLHFKLALKSDGNWPVTWDPCGGTMDKTFIS
jgi:hypothetical protein